MPNSKRGGLPGLSRCVCFKSLLDSRMHALRLNKVGLGRSSVVGAIGVHNTLSLVPCMFAPLLFAICYFMIVFLLLT